MITTSTTTTIILRVNSQETMDRLYRRTEVSFGLSHRAILPSLTCPRTKWASWRSDRPASCMIADIPNNLGKFRPSNRTKFKWGQVNTNPHGTSIIRSKPLEIRLLQLQRYRYNLGTIYNNRFKIVKRLPIFMTRITRRQGWMNHYAT